MSPLSMCFGGVLFMSSVAVGQAGFLITIDYGPGQTNLGPANPSCTVKISARFSPNDHAVAGAWWDVDASEAGWSDNILPPPLNNTRGTNPGTINGSAVEDIIAGQIFFPSGGIQVNTSNPILLWRATFTASVFTNRQVTISTTTHRFDVYVDPNRPRSEGRLSGFSEGQAVIAIVPAPAGAMVLLAGASGLWARRRRR
jgi:hypothetical protein